MLYIDAYGWSEREGELTQRLFVSRAQMDSFIRIREMLKRTQTNGAKPMDLRQIEDEVLLTYQKFDNEVKALTKDLLTKTNDLQSKTSQCEVLIKEQFDLYKDLVSTKESAGSLIKYLNISLKSSSIVVARTIVEMTCKSELQSIVTNAESVANSFRRNNNYVSQHAHTHTRKNQQWKFVLGCELKLDWHPHECKEKQGIGKTEYRWPRRHWNLFQLVRPTSEK